MPDPRRIGHAPETAPVDPSVDPELSVTVGPEDMPRVGASLSADLERAVREDVVYEPLFLQITARPSLKVEYSTEINDELLTKWRKAAADRKAPDGFDAMRFACIVVANQCQAIWINGVRAQDEDGWPYTFASDKIKEWTGVANASNKAIDAARALIGKDPHVMLHCAEILDVAGFGDVMANGDVEDPTVGRSPG